jgi:hypothetical protein
MASTCEIVLVIALVIVLVAWYYMAVYRTAKPSCHMSAAPAMAPVQATPTSIDDGFGVVEKEAYTSEAAPNALDMKDQGWEQSATSSGLASTNDALAPFDEAPSGSAAAWPSTAEGSLDASASAALTGQDVSNANRTAPIAYGAVRRNDDEIPGLTVGTKSFQMLIEGLTGKRLPKPFDSGTAGSAFNQVGGMPMQDTATGSGAASYAYRNMGQNKLMV